MPALLLAAGEEFDFFFLGGPAGFFFSPRGGPAKEGMVF